MNHLNVLTKPLTKEEIKVMMSKNRCIKGVIPVWLDDMIGCSFDDFLYTLSETLTDTPCLTDISYKIVGVVDDGAVAMEVSGGGSEVLAFYGEK